jgi:hypothetical protein
VTQVSLRRLNGLLRLRLAGCQPLGGRVMVAAASASSASSVCVLYWGSNAPSMPDLWWLDKYWRAPCSVRVELRGLGYGALLGVGTGTRDWDHPTSP